MKQPRFRLFERPVCSKSGCVWPEANNPGNNTDRSKNDGRLIKKSSVSVSLFSADFESIPHCSGFNCQITREKK